MSEMTVAVKSELNILVIGDHTADVFFIYVKMLWTNSLFFIFCKILVCQSENFRQFRTYLFHCFCLNDGKNPGLRIKRKSELSQFLQSPFRSFSEILTVI